MLSWPCSRCGEFKIYRSRYRHLWERALLLLLLRPVRCGCCERRFFRFVGFEALRRPAQSQPAGSTRARA
ncbi:MAG TPA: hypothetical protein VFU76_03660 [Terriglobales bacterium]|nr:hypothetical protein [Terriglobales bacterium]